MLTEYTEGMLFIQAFMPRAQKLCAPRIYSRGARIFRANLKDPAHGSTHVHVDFMLVTLVLHLVSIFTLGVDKYERLREVYALSEHSTHVPTHACVDIITHVCRLPFSCIECMPHLPFLDNGALVLKLFEQMIGLRKA